MIIYDVIFIIFSVFYIPFSIFKKGKRAFNIRQRCGLGLADHSSPTVWLHAVSVGEVMALGQLVEKIRNQMSAHPVVISVTTKAGYEVARKNFSQSAAVIYSPLDLSFIVNRFFRLIRPKVLVIVETELWPNLITAAKNNKVPVILINGRISPRSFGRYRFAKFFLMPTLEKIDLFCMQSEIDKERVIAIGAPAERVKVTGNMKFDIVEHQSTIAPERQLEGIRLVAGSTHKGEEEILISVYKELTKEFKNLKLLIAPRHINRIPEIKKLTKDVPGIFLIDTVGHLKDYYAIADIVFIGGSLVPHGGQNPLEAAYFSKPVIFGPFMFNFTDISQALLKKGAAIQIEDAKGLKAAVEDLINSPARRNEMGIAAKLIIKENKGASARNAELIENLTKFSRSDFLVRAYIHSIMTDKATGVLAAVLKFIFLCLSFLYLCGIKIISALRKCGLLPVEQLKARVISIGNLTLGGTGKTPLVEFVARQLLTEGFKPAILTRGYKVSSGEPDEPLLLRRKLPQVSVLIGPERIKNARVAIEKYGADTLVLDDGFQYRRLKRDVDILMIDAANPFGNEKLIPRGILREPVRNFQRADIVVISKSDFATADNIRLIKERVSSLGPDMLVVSSVHKPVKFVDAADKDMPLEWIKDKECVVVSGIAEPAYFLHTLKALGAIVKANLIFPDHHPYSFKDLDAIYNKCKELSVLNVVTTEKDMIRLEPLLREYSPDIKAQFLALAAQLEITENKDKFIECLTKFCIR